MTSTILPNTNIGFTQYSVSESVDFNSTEISFHVKHWHIYLFANDVVTLIIGFTSPANHAASVQSFRIRLESAPPPSQLSAAEYKLHQLQL